MPRFISLLMLLSALFVAGTAQAQTPAPAKGGLLIRVHVFSGRPDPEFRITDPAEIAKIAAMLKAHADEDTSAANEEVITHKLGYRGISIIAEEGLPGLEGISALAVRGDRIQIHRRVNGVKKATHHRDAAATLEGYLIARGMAQGHVETRVADRIFAR